MYQVCTLKVWLPPSLPDIRKTECGIFARLTFVKSFVFAPISPMQHDPCFRRKTDCCEPCRTIVKSRINNAGEFLKSSTQTNVIHCCIRRIDQNDSVGEIAAPHVRIRAVRRSALQNAPESRANVDRLSCRIVSLANG